jgi:hypothetical protein
MKVNLRFGMHKDIEAIHHAHNLLDGLVIPAHILAHQRASTVAFVCSLPKHDYVIDPRTWVLPGERGSHRNDSGELRPSIAKWCDVIHPDLKAGLETGSHASIYSISDLPPLAECCAGNYRFQTETVNVGHVDPRAKKYLDRYGLTRPTLPRCVLPPYFCFREVGDEAYTTTVEAARITLGMAGDLPVAPVIMCNAAVLEAAAVRRIVRDFGSFPRCFIFIESFSQATARPETIRRVRALVDALCAAESSVETLFGGFLMMMMEHDGLEAISHGILYAQDKSIEQASGGGMVPERYYIPSFHDFRSLSQTNLILKKHPELAGGTPTADSVMGGDPDRIFLFASRPGLLRQHFLEARRAECDLLAAQSMPDIVAELRETHQRYHRSVSRLPNPDAVISGGAMKGLDYLLSWAEAFT